MILMVAILVILTFIICIGIELLIQRGGLYR